MTLLNYGFIALDLLSIIPADAGEYTCRVTSSSGTAQSTAVLRVEGTDENIFRLQLHVRNVLR